MKRNTAEAVLVAGPWLLAAFTLGFCSACHDGGSTQGTAPSTTPSDAAEPTQGMMGPPNCGLSSAAFCDGFDAPSKTRGGRAGDLDPKLWSASRLAPQGPTAMGAAFPVGAAVLPKCRAGTPDLAWPPDDTLVCDPSDDIKNAHLLVAVASQNYGLNSYRIRQPFDFAGRTGKIVFDAQGYATLGWISLEVTDEPIAVPSYAIYVNDEGGVIPKNGFEVQFSQTCGQGGTPTVFGMRTFHEFHDYADAVQLRDSFDCPSAKKGKLNHFEITVAQDKIEVFVSPFSADGVTFEAPTLMFSTAARLPFTRGYVHITTHNHATLKYSTGTWSGNQGETDLDAWIAEWDNVGFDGVILRGTREYEAPDSSTPGTVDLGDPHNPTKRAVNVGYIVPDLATGASAPIKFTGVDLDQAKRAELAVTAWYPSQAKIADVVLKYRFNGGAWRDRKITAAEAALYSAPAVNGANGKPEILGAIGQMIDVDVSDLMAGDNTLELATVNSPQALPPGVANVDLIVHTE